MTHPTKKATFNPDAPGLSVHGFHHLVKGRRGEGLKVAVPQGREQAAAGRPQQVVNRFDEDALEL